MHGHGVFTWPDGRRYQGDYVNDKKHGFGIYTWSNGREYAGQWENGQQHGQGIYKDINGVERTGLWEEGKRVAWLDDDDYGEQMEEVNRAKEEA